MERELGSALALALLLMLASTAFSRTATLNFFSLAALALAFSFRKSETEFSRGVASLALVVSLVWSEVRFLPMVGLLAIWLPLPGRGAPEKTRLTRLAVWIFTTFAVALVHIFRSSNSQALEIAHGMMNTARKIEPGLALALNQVQTFRVVLFAAMAFLVFLILRLDRWFPSTYGNQINRKRLLMVLGISFLILVALVLSHTVGLSLTLRVHGINSPALIFKQLGP